MFDGALRRMTGPALDACGRAIARTGLSADRITVIGFSIGLAGAGAIALGHFTAGLCLVLLNRAADGLDGAVARATRLTDLGGFLDITLDFFFYAALPVAFAIADPSRNGFAAAILLASFLANGAAFLSYALIAERRGIQTAVQGLKSIYYVAGVAEGAETIAAFSLFCIFPGAFPWLAAGFAALCFASALGRTILAWRTFR
jgi:phosphatidylglycerophosphate synthase